MERKLAAILAADVVGYSALMERDEAGTFERLRAGRKELIEPEIGKHHGRIFKLMGDGLLAEFASVVDAVECAVSLQRGMADRNNALPRAQRIQVRVGINLGEVIVEGKDRYGEGVNIAARLQQIADPGGICVSGKVAKEVEKRLAFGFEPLGEQRMKNIAEPIAVYRVKLDGVPRRRVWRVHARHWRWAAAAIAVLVLLAGGFWAINRPGPEPGGIPALAVLPFTSMTKDESGARLADGITETSSPTFRASRISW